MKFDMGFKSKAGLLAVAGFLGSTALQAQLKRFHRDEPRPRIVMEASKILGERHGGELHLSEREAIEMALVNNLEINLRRMRPLTAFQEVEFRQAIYEPFVLFGLDWNRNRVPTGSVLAGGDSVTDVVTDYAFGYRQDFVTGTAFEFDFNADRNRSTNTFASLVPAISTNFSFTLRQNLLQGFGRRDGDYDIELARNDVELSRSEFETAVNDVILQVQEGYWDLQFSLRDIQVQEKAVELAATVLEQNRARFEVGTAARLEVVEAEAELALRRELLIRAQYNHRLVQDRLISLITDSADPRTPASEIIPTDPVASPPRPSASFGELLEKALEHRPELAESDVEILNRGVELERSRNQLKPTLDLVLGYRKFGLGGRQVIRDFSQGFVDAPIIGVNPGGALDSLEQLFASDFYGYTIALDLRVPLGNRAARSRNAEAQIGLDRERLQRRSIEQRIAVELREVLTRIDMNRAQIVASEAAVRLEQERLDGREARFDVGLSTTREVIESQRDLTTAESVLLRNRVALVKNAKRLSWVLGETLESLGIRLADALETNVVRPGT